MADDIASLGIAVDSSQVDKGTESLRNFEAVARRTGETADQVQARFKSLAAAQTQSAQAINPAVTAAAQFTAAQQKVIQSLNEGIAIVSMSGRELAIHTALTKANTLENTAAGAAIANLAGHQYDLAHESEHAGEKIAEQRLKFRALAEAANQVGGPLGGLIQQAGYLTIGSQHLSVGLIGTTVAAGALVEGIVKLIQAEKELAAVGDVSKRVGVSGAQFQQLEFAGGLKGLSTDDLSKGAQGLAANLNEGVKHANDLSQLFGLNNKSLVDSSGHAKSLVDVLADVANMVKNAATEQDKFAIAQAAGIPPTRQWLSLLEQGGPAIRKAMDDGKLAGVGASDELIKKAQELEDKYNELTTRLSMGWRTFAVEAGDAIAKVISQMNPGLAGAAIPGVGAVKSAIDMATGSRATSGDGERLAQLIDQQTQLNTQLEHYRQLSDDPSNPFVERSTELAGDFQRRLENVNAEIEKIRAQPPLEFAAGVQDIGKNVGGDSASGASATKLVADLTKQSADEANRHLQSVQAIAAAYEGVSVQTALILEKQKDELAVASAVGGAQRLAAQQIQAQNALLLQGKTLEEATRIAAGQRAIAQAQINAQAKETLFGLQNQAAAAGAVTGEQQIQATAQATYNQLIHDGVEATTALAIKAQMVANAHAEANANVEREIHSLEQATELTQSGNDMNVKAAQAYDNAIRSGASSTKAAALEAAVLDNEMAKVAAKLKSIPWTQGGTGSAQNSFGMDGSGGGWLGGAASASTKFNGPAVTQDDINKFGSQAQMPGSYLQLPGMRLQWDKTHTSGGISNSIDQELSRGGTLQSAIEMLKKQQSMFNITPGRPGFDENQAAIIDLTKRIAEQDKGAGAAGLQKLIAELELQPHTLARDDAIKDLTDKIKELTTSTEDLNSTMQVSLDPIYTQGHDALKIGYYGEGSGGGTRTVTATDWPTGTAPGTATQPSGGQTQPFEQMRQPNILPGPGPNLDPSLYDRNSPHPGMVWSGFGINGGMWVPAGSPNVGVSALGQHAASGLEETVGGFGGTDSQLMKIWTTPGEKVSVKTPQQVANDNRSSVVNNVVNNYNDIKFSVPASSNLGNRSTQRQVQEGFGRSMAATGR